MVTTGLAAAVGGDGKTPTREGSAPLRRLAGLLRPYHGRLAIAPDYVGVAAPRVQPFIQAALLLAAREGWRADEPTDFSTLFSRSRVRTTNGFIRWHVSMVTIRLVRPVRG